MTDSELYESFDGCVWAKEFSDIHRRKARIHQLEFEDGTVVRQPTPFTSAEIAKAKFYLKSESIADDEETMKTWFCSALMRGYDEHRWRSKQYKRRVRSILAPWWKRWFIPLDKYGH